MINPGSIDHEAGSTRRGVPATRSQIDARRRSSPDEAVSDAVPFGAFLDALTHPPGANRARGSAASSFGVFQGGNASGHEQKKVALREGQASRRADAQVRYDVDRTGVGARRSNQAQARGADSPSPHHAATEDQSRSSGLIRDAISPRLAGSGGRLGDSALTLDRLGDSVRQGDSHGAQTPRIESGGPNAAPSPRGNSSSPQIAQSSGAAGIHPSAPSSSADVAQEVGRTLGASRVGEVESARAPTGTTHAGLDRTGRQAPGRNGPPLAGSRSKQTDSSPHARATKDMEPTPFDRLVRSMRMQAGAHRSTARMMLEPPELGRVLVDVAMVGDVVEVSVRAETSQARELLQDRVAQLRRALLMQGIEIERFTVASDWPGEAAAANSDGTGGSRDDASAPAPRSRRMESPREVGRDAGPSEGNKNEPRSLNVRNTVAERRIDVRI